MAKGFLEEELQVHILSERGCAYEADHEIEVAALSIVAPGRGPEEVEGFYSERVEFGGQLS